MLRLRGDPIASYWHINIELLVTSGLTSEANIIKKKDKLLGRFIPYLTCKIRNKDTQYVVLFKHDILGIFIPYFTRQIWNKTAQ